MNRTRPIVFEDFLRHTQEAYDQAIRDKQDSVRIARPVQVLLSYPEAIQAAIIDAWKRGIDCRPFDYGCLMLDVDEHFHMPETNAVPLHHVLEALASLVDFQPQGWERQDYSQQLALLERVR